MGMYYLVEIRELAHQLRISPRHLRPGQVEGVVRLIDEVLDPANAYPFDLVCFHITGYRAKAAAPDGSLPAKELIHDLAGLVDEITTDCPISAGSVPGPVHDAAQLAQRLSVSTKTVQRWRWRGLLGLKLAWPDGSVKVGFCEPTVSRFVTRHPDLVRRAAAFRNLSAEEKTRLIRRARELAKVRRTTLHEVAKQIAEETGRAVETVRYTIRRHDSRNKDRPVFDEAGRPVVNLEHQRLYHAHRAGASAEDLAAKGALTVASVRRIVREMRVRELQAKPPEFIYNLEFDAPGAEAAILGTDANGSASRDSRSVVDTSLLRPTEERELFRRYNYVKCKARTRLDAIEPTRVKAARLATIESLLRQAERIRNRIAQANLRLVTSIAKRHLGPKSMDFAEAISDGNLSLLRAIEKFDYARGFKFSTYASWAIIRNYARTIPEEHYRMARYVTGTDELLAAAADARADSRPDHKLAGVGEAVAQVLDLLNTRERAVVADRYGLTSDQGPRTLAQTGRTLGVTKERIRQIERSALEKLRAALGPHQHDLFD